jgi:hypothetical protein
MIEQSGIQIDLPYAVFTAPSKSAAEQMVRGRAGSNANWGSRWSRGPEGDVTLSGLFNSTHVFLAHYKKFRKKVFRDGDLAPKIVNGEMVLFNTSTIIEAAHWNVTLYKFPIGRVLNAKQHARRFEVTLTY